MTLRMHEPLSWKRALYAQHPGAAEELAMLNDLQGNILKGHGRDHTRNLFLRFAHEDSERARQFIKSLALDVTTALDQLTKAQVYKSTGADAGLFTAFLISSAGYKALGASEAMPSNDAFLAGMRERDLNDPPIESWDDGFQKNVHAMALLASDDENHVDREMSALIELINETGGAVTLAGIEKGRAIRNDDTNGIEHFGYVDGRSQPLALQEDVDQEKLDGGIDKWNPSIPLAQLLVKCPGGNLNVSHGSYFVFRKLEQNVRGFKEAEDELASANDIIGERAGASVIGRFENGTPVTAHKDEVPAVKPGDKWIPNNFNYESDQGGLRCPFAGHIRKTNPRNDDLRTNVHLMARRGILYGERTDKIDDKETASKPTHGVGLLFMAYQSDLVDQFEFTQRMWSNNEDFERPDVGLDPVIGQSVDGETGATIRIPKSYDRELGAPFNFQSFVKMLGGEYFFAPSISFLKSLA